MLVIRFHPEPKSELEKMPRLEAAKITFVSGELLATLSFLICSVGNSTRTRFHVLRSRLTCIISAAFEMPKIEAGWWPSLLEILTAVSASPDDSLIMLQCLPWSLDTKLSPERNGTKVD